MRETKRTLWESWLDRNVDADDPVPLFNTEDDLTVSLVDHGRAKRRPVLERSREMEASVRSAVAKVVDDHETRRGRYDGVVYMMYTLDRSELVPLYIGKSGKFKKESDGLSANLEHVESNDNKFARWGYGNAYHMGDLSAAALDACDDVDTSNHGSPKAKYRTWARRMFETGTRRLQRPVYFWIRAWDRSEGPYPDTYPYLAELEYQLIGIAYELYPETLLNTEGVPNNPDAYAKMREWIHRDQTGLDDF